MRHKIPIVEIVLFIVQSICAFLYPEELAQKLLIRPDEDANFVNIIFTGDTQYHYPCTENNGQCKERSRNCRAQKQQAAASARRGRNESTTRKLETFLANFVDEGASSDDNVGGPNCIQMESEFANEVQRKGIFRLIRLLEGSGQKTAALVINGDLTNFGHHFQLELFKVDWLRTIPVPILVGLGNHDYENNVDDCMGNVCAERMLRWFTQEYVPSMRREGEGERMIGNMDLRERRMLWKTIFEGSLAYSSQLCAAAASTNQVSPSSLQHPPFCVHSIQLHNRPDYAATIEYPTGQWQIRGSFQWLLAELTQIAAMPTADSRRRQIVLINLHNHALKVAQRLRGTLELWHRLNVAKGVAPLDFMVLFAHIHENHSVGIRCINGRKVPHIFVGSVPNNRFTTIRFHSEGTRAEIFLLQSNANSSEKIVQMVDFEWSNC